MVVAADAGASVARLRGCWLDRDGRRTHPVLNHGHPRPAPEPFDDHHLRRSCRRDHVRLTIDSINERAADRDGSIEAEHGGERLVDGPHLVGCELSNATPEPLGIDGTDLFDEHPSRVSSD